MTSSSPSVWETKSHVESQYPHFPEIDVSAPDFDIPTYMQLVRTLRTAANIPHYPFPVTWTNLTCTVPLLQSSNSIASVVSMFQSFFNGIRHGFASLHPNHSKDHAPPATADVLHNVSGYIKPGQMCLLIGTSRSGTSLLLSRLADRTLPSLVHTSGEVLYGGDTRLGGIARPVHALRFIQQQDHHIAELTVRQTLEFASACRTPPWTPYADIIRKNAVIVAAKVLGISRTLDTIVGSDVLRGISGGERKRVTIGEMAIGLTGGAILLDNWSKGLDSATTLSITRSMRNFSNATKGTVIASMTGPGVEAFNLFDTLCLMHQGRVIYFGPVNQAEEYFHQLGFRRPKNRSVPDFVSTITEEKLRSEYVDNDTDTGTLPVTSEDFAKRFEQSEQYREMMMTIEQINAQKGVQLSKSEHKIAKMAGRLVIQSPFSQLKALSIRQMRYLLSVKKNIFAQLIQNFLFGIILGSVFWQLPDTAGGADSRTGILFLSLLSIGLSALATLGSRFEEKIIFTKQREASFFVSWTYLLTQAFFDFILELVQAACLIIPLYLMCGLNIGSSGQRLMYAIIISTFTSLTMISLSRFFISAIPDPNAAQAFAGLLTILFVLFTGYLKSSSEMQGWMVWIYWIDPLHYAYESLVLNEFEGLTLNCETNTDGGFSPCAPSSGEDYIRDNLNINGDLNLAYYFLILVSFNVVFFMASAIATALAKAPGHKQSVNSDEDESSHLSSPSNKEVVVDFDTGSCHTQKTSFTFTNLVYKVENGEKVLLDNVTGNAVSGKVVLLMGESGAGKTTLLDVCAMRKTLKSGASLEGQIRVNGQVLSKKNLALISGYCEQNDLHIGEATVREALLFSAKLRLPATMDISEKTMRVQETITDLGLEPYQNVLVKALGSGELKLLTMGVELVSNPKVLFLDEPTSGIPSSSAMTVARVLKTIASKGTCVICTVHQPSKEVFTLFDQLLLLKRGGKVVYFGDIGDNGRSIRDYFEARGAEKMDDILNPADWMLNVIGNEETDWVEEWKSSREKKEMDEQTRNLVENTDSEDALNLEKLATRPGFNVQAKEVIQRQFWRYWRLPEYNTTRVILMFFIALLVGILFLREIDNTKTGAGLAFAALFLSLIPANLSAQNVVLPTSSGRVVFYREIASGLYRPAAHHVAVGLVELPFTFVATTVFTVVFYFLVGLDASRFFYFFVAVQVLYFFSVMFGVMMAVITPSPNLARTLISVIFSIFNVLSGFFIKKPEIPVWWRWSLWINPFAYYLSGILQNQMKDQIFTCTADELVTFPLPLDQFESCASIPDGTYTDIIRNGIRLCQFCPLTSGQALIDQFEADDVNKWISVLNIALIIVLVRIVTGIGFAKLRFLNR